MVMFTNWVDLSILNGRENMQKMVNRVSNLASKFILSVCLPFFYFYLFPNRIESIGEENSLLAIEQINGIDSVQYRGYKCLQIKVKNSSKINIFLRFETEPEYRLK